MISLNDTDSLQAIASGATSVTSTITGDEIASGVDTFKTLDQRQIPAIVTSLYSPGAGKAALIKTWLLANTSAGTVTVTLYMNGTAAANQVASLPIPANGEAVLADDGWKVFDGNGGFVTSSVLSISGDITASGTGTVVATIAGNAVTNAKMAQMAAHTYKGNNTGSTATPIDVTAAQLTADLSVVTTSAQGVMSANDKKKLDNLWYDVTDYGFVGDGSTDNLSAWSTLLSTVPVGAVIYFPSGTYNTSGEFTINVDKHLKIIGAGEYTTTICSTSTTANIFNITAAAWFNTFADIGFTSSVTKTAGAAIAITSGSAVGTDVRRCYFTKMFYGIYASGSQSANVSVWDSLNMGTSGPAPWPVNGRGIKIDGDTINLVISNSTINLGSGPGAISGSADIEINQSGSIQIVGCDFIGGGNTLLLNASSGGSSSIAAVFCTNTFFDQSGGSTVKITGANIVNRVKFVQCGITGGNVAGANAVEIASTGTAAAGQATAAADGIDFFDCDIYPNGGTGTINGILITGAQGVNISSCRISGWTNGINVTPVAANGYTKISVQSNKMGATNNFTTPNTNGLVLNAGSFTYGAVVVTGNDFTGSTTPLTENAAVTFPWQERYENNVGIVNKYNAPASTANQAFTSGATGIINGTSLSIPTNGLRVGTTIRWIAPLSKTAAGSSLTFAVKFGVNNSAADGNVATGTFAGSLAADSGVLTATLVVTAIGAAATAVANFVILHGASASGLVSTANGSVVSGTMSSFNTTASSPFFNLAITANTTTVPTFLAPVTAEILF